MKSNVFFLNILFLMCILYDASSQSLNPWSSIGPFGKVPDINSPTTYRGNGIVNCVAVHPTDTNIVYIGTAGGVWRSDDRGDHWNSVATLNEIANSLTISIGNIIVDPTDPSYIFVSTGNRAPQGFFYSPEPYTSGIFRAKLVGNTYTWTNMSAGLPSLSQFDANGYYVGYNIGTIQKDPLNPNVMYAGTTKGLYKTTNAYAASPTWSQVSAIPSVPINSVVFTNVNITAQTCTYYVTGDNLLLTSTNFITWSSLLGTCSNCIDFTNSYYTSKIGGPVDFSSFFAAASKKYSNKVYISVKTDNTANNQYTRYLYTYDGTTLLNLRQLYADASYWGNLFNQNLPPVITTLFRDPSIYPLPNSSYEIVVLGFEGIEGMQENNLGGYTYFKSTSGYSTESCEASHADIRDVVTSQNNRYIYCANDGMLSKFNPFKNISSDNCDNWDPTANLNIALSRAWGVSTSYDNARIVTGYQDDGVNVYRKNIGWNSIMGGDGYEQYIQGDYMIFNSNDNPFNYKFNPDNSMSGISGFNFKPFATRYYRSCFKEYKDTTVSYLIGNIKNCGPQNHATIYKVNLATINDVDCATHNANNLIGDFTDITHFNQYSPPSAFAVAPSNSKTIYIAFSVKDPSHQGDMYGLPTTNLYVTNTGGVPYYSWTKLPLPTANLKDRLHSIAVSYTDPNTLIIGFMNAVTNRPRIYISRDGGYSWTDYNNSLGTIPNQSRIHTLTYEKGSKDGVYVGTDNGVYYTRNDLGGWINYNNNFPTVAVTELVYNPRSNLINASTWGRGIWQVYPMCPSGITTVTNTNITYGTSMGGTFNGTDINYTASMSGISVDLKANNSVNFNVGASYNAGQNMELDAYIAPCGSGQSNLKIGNSDNSVSQNDNIESPASSYIPEANPINIYPNPSLGDVNITFSIKEGEMVDIIIYDLAGQEIYKGKIETLNQILEIDLEGKAHGAYLVKAIKNNKEVFTRHFILGDKGSTEEDEMEHFRYRKSQRLEKE